VLAGVVRPAGGDRAPVGKRHADDEVDGVAWEAVTRARNFAAYVPGDFPNAHLELIILLPEA